MYKKDNIRIINREDSAYPARLREIYDPPERLFCIGDVNLFQNRGLAVVGSRKCSEYGRQTALKIAKAAAKNNLAVISGMAKGIDGCAHRGALQAGGKTIAVLGCGPDICYPAENRSIYEQIKKEGLIVSEYPPGTGPKPFAFPRRNRIISALSEAVIIVEAGTGSGALITAEIAAEQGKEVFAVPGNISSQYSLGTNKLIADGARPVAVVDDIFREIGICPAEDEEVISGLGTEEEMLYRLVKEKGEVTVDYICAALGKSPVYVNGIVAVLEIKGLVSYSLGKIFVANF